MSLKTPYRIFEQTVLGAYNSGRLDKTLLSLLMEPYRDMKMDFSGNMGTPTHDGKVVEEVVIETYGLELPPNRPGNDATQEEWGLYRKPLLAKMKEVTQRFNW